MDNPKELLDEFRILAREVNMPTEQLQNALPVWESILEQASANGSSALKYDALALKKLIAARLE